MVIESVFTEFDIKLRQFILRRVSDPDDAEDILQEVYIRIHQHAGDLREEEKLQSWIYQIARNAIIDSYRRRRDTAELLEESVLLDPIPEPDATRQLASSLKTMIDSLPEKYAQALTLVELEGMTQQALAEHLGISLSGAKSRVQRAREKLHEAFLDCCHFEFDRMGQIVHYQPRCTACAAPTSPGGASAVSDNR